MAITARSHLPFTRHNRARFLYNLDVELLKHWANLQRALDGKSSFYVPDPEQRENLAKEQERIDAARHGADVLARIWKVQPRPGKEIPRRARHALVHEALTLTERTLEERLVAQGVVSGFSLNDVAGLEVLFHYLDAKVCLMKKLGKPCLEYQSISSEIGYITGSKV